MSPAIDRSISICPRGWRTPTGGVSEDYWGEFQYLNRAINSGSEVSDTGLRETWLGMYNGYWGIDGYYYQSQRGYLWSSTERDASNYYGMIFSNTSASPGFSPFPKSYGHAVRCIF